MKKVLLILLSLLGVGLILPLGLFWDNEIFLMIVNMLRGLVVMAILYCAIIWIYFRFRRKADKKYVVEIGTVLSVLALSVAGKVLAIIMKVDDNGNFSVELPKDGWQAVAAIYYSLYQSIGGLSFEGLANYDYYESWRTIVYAGTSVLAGLVAISIITFSFSYEIYSTAAWLTTWKRNRKIYVFTAVTEDSVTLAHSIADHHAKNGQKYLIIFLRTEGQEGFDGKNPLHIDIMHSGFLFRSYSPGRKNKSIPEFLGIKIKNDYCLQKDNVFEKHKKDIEADKVAELHIFALDWEKDKISENDKLVCEDVARIATRLFNKKLTLKQRIKLLFTNKDIPTIRLSPQFLSKINGYGMITEYHFLVSKDIDTANVDMRFENEIAKFARSGESDSQTKKSADLRTLGELAKEALYADDTTKVDLDKIKDEEEKERRAKEEADKEFVKNTFLKFKQHFVFDALSEANMASFSYVRKRAQLVDECKDLYKADVLSEEYRTLVIGFGQNGQQVMKAAYIFAAAGEHSEPGNNVKEELFADPDKKGRYPAEWTRQLQRSDYVKYTPQPFIADVYDKNASEVGGLFRMKHPAISVDMPQSKSSSYRYAFAPVKVVLHHESAYSNKLLKKLDLGFGDDEQDETEDDEQVDYNLIIIALGDDDSNVNIANALLEDSKHEILSPEKKNKEKYQVIAINLRNKLNYDRINWTEKDEKKFEYIKVIRFGSSEEMYSYDNVVDMSRAKKWNHGYNIINTNKTAEKPDGNKEKVSLNNNDFKETPSSENANIKEPDKNTTMYKIRKAVNDVVESKGKQNTTVGVYFEGIREKLGDKAYAEYLWHTLSGKLEMYYQRLSSRYACEMPSFIKGYCVAKGFCEEGGYENVRIDDMIRLGAVEHDRWTRYMVACGFKYGKKELYFKEHHCIIDYKYISSQYNDMINVMNAFLLNKKGEHNDPKKI